ncbi:hypothetical protein L1887_39272 [Cichorium endivia]|nr:hypothetical protein L1887_39272 [Cichorium endivia]
MSANTFQMLYSICIGIPTLLDLCPTHFKQIILSRLRCLTAKSYNSGKEEKERFLPSSDSLTSVIQS